MCFRFVCQLPIKTPKSRRFQISKTKPLSPHSEILATAVPCAHHIVRNPETHFRIHCAANSFRYTHIP